MKDFWLEVQKDMKAPGWGGVLIGAWFFSFVLFLAVLMLGAIWWGFSWVLLVLTFVFSLVSGLIINYRLRHRAFVQVEGVEIMREQVTGFTR